MSTEDEDVPTDWALRVAKLVHGFYRDAWDALHDQYEDEVWDAVASGWEEEEMIMLQMHAFALRRLAELREREPSLSHLQLHEFIARNQDSTAFAADFWVNRDLSDSQAAQRAVARNDDGKGQLVSACTAEMMLERYGDLWIEMDDQAFEDAWQECRLEVSHQARHRIVSWEA